MHDGVQMLGVVAFLDERVATIVTLKGFF